MDSNEPFDALMIILDQALDNTKTVLNERKLKVAQVDMQIKTTTTTDATGGLKFSVLSADANAEYKRSGTGVQTISLSFEPVQQSLKYTADLKKEESELINAIEIINNAVVGAIQKLPSFKITKAIAEIDFGITQDGNGQVSFVVGGSLDVSKDVVNVLSIQLEPDNPEETK